MLKILLSKLNYVYNKENCTTNIVHNWWEGTCKWSWNFFKWVFISTFDMFKQVFIVLNAYLHMLSNLPINFIQIHWLHYLVEAVLRKILKLNLHGFNNCLKHLPSLHIMFDLSTKFHQIPPSSLWRDVVKRCVDGWTDTKMG